MHDAFVNVVPFPRFLTHSLPLEPAVIARAFVLLSGSVAADRSHSDSATAAARLTVTAESDCY